MGYRVMNQDLYDSLVIAYREKPGNHTNAGLVAGCDRRMAKRAWSQGWSRLPWAKPIEQVLKDEQVLARAAVQEARRDEFLEHEAIRQAAMQEAVDARAEEGRMVRHARSATTELLGQALRAIKAADPFIKRLELSSQLEAAEMDLPDVLRTLDRIARMTQLAASTAQDAMKLERMHLGQPENLIGITIDGDTDELRAELKAIEAILGDSGDVLDAEIVG